MQGLAVICFVFGLVSFGHWTRVAGEIHDCGSTVGQLKEVKVSGCDGKPVCPLVRDTNASIEIRFVSEKQIPDVLAVVHGVILDVPMPFPLRNPDACADPHSNIKCPLTEKTEYIYRQELPILKGYPKMSLKVKWELQSPNKEDIVCILIPAKIV